MTIMVERLIKSIDGQKLQVHPTCFFLEWNHPSGPQATWLNREDIQKDKIVFSQYVKWTDLRYDVLLASDTLNASEDQFQVDIENQYRNVSFLKSHLQKVIRRSNSYKAIKTAWHFIDINLHDFLRRLAIIAVEDCLPLDGYSILIWFMSAVSKGYILSNSQIAWCLGYVYDLSNCKYYEQYPHRADDKLPTQREMRLFNLSPKGRDLVYSILFRQSYGGMKSDKHMCRVAALHWANRYHSKSRYLDMLKRSNIFITAPLVELEKREWVLAALDFHCCPNIIGAMWEKHDEYSEADIKSAIWHCSSSLTDKNLLSEDLLQRDVTNDKWQAIWKVIKKDFHGYAKFLLEKQG